MSRDLDKIIEIGRIYKITNDIDNMYYIGSTDLTIEERLEFHRFRASQPECKTHRYFNEIGWDNINIEELEQREDIRLEDLLLLENTYLIDVVRIDSNCLNCNIAYIPEDKRSEWESEMNKKWYLNNIEYAKQRNIDWHKEDFENDPEKYRERGRKQYQREREDILKKKKEQRQGEDGDAIRERERKAEKARRDHTQIECECGGTYNDKTKNDHFKTDTHRQFEGMDPLQNEDKKQRKKKVTTICQVCFGSYTKYSICNEMRHNETKQHKEAVRLRESGAKTEDVYTICQICFAPYMRKDKHLQSQRHLNALK